LCIGGRRRLFREVAEHQALFGCLGQASLFVASAEWFFIRARHVQIVYVGAGVEVGIDVDQPIIIDVIFLGWWDGR
jgi:hypothetical protein